MVQDLIFLYIFFVRKKISQDGRKDPVGDWKEHERATEQRRRKFRREVRKLKGRLRSESGRGVKRKRSLSREYTFADKHYEEF